MLRIGIPCIQGYYIFFFSNAKEWHINISIHVVFSATFSSLWEAYSILCCVPVATLRIDTIVCFIDKDTDMQKH